MLKYKNARSELSVKKRYPITSRKEEKCNPGNFLSEDYFLNVHGSSVVRSLKSRRIRLQLIIP